MGKRKILFAFLLFIGLFTSFCYAGQKAAANIEEERNSGSATSTSADKILEGE